MHNILCFVEKKPTQAPAKENLSNGSGFSSPTGRVSLENRLALIAPRGAVEKFSGRDALPRVRNRKWKADAEHRVPTGATWKRPG